MDHGVGSVPWQDKQIDPQYQKRRKRWIERPQFLPNESNEDDICFDAVY